MKNNTNNNGMRLGFCLYAGMALFAVIAVFAIA